MAGAYAEIRVEAWDGQILVTNVGRIPVLLEYKEGLDWRQNILGVAEKARIGSMGFLKR